MPKKLIVIGMLLALLTVTLGLTETRNGGSQTAGGASAGSVGSNGGPAPHLSASTRAIGGTVSWQVTQSSTAARIDNAYLPASVATGVYVIMDVVADNGSARAVDLDGDDIGLELAGTRYPVDQSALASLELAGDSTLTPVELSPGASASGWLVFDVPSAVAGSAARLCVDRAALAASAAAAACS
jgi:hypothetical protein